MIAASRLAKGLWWDRAWSLVDGCTPVSEGCENCWARAMARRWGRVSDKAVTMRADRLGLPGERRKPSVYAVWNDLFHEAVVADFIFQAHRAAFHTQQHRHVLLTKRPARLLDTWGRLPVLSNVIIGTTVENQRWADVRIPQLLACPAGVRMLSVEPLLEPIDLRAHLHHGPCPEHPSDGIKMASFGCMGCRDRIGWVVVGPETGSRRRACRLEWVESIVGQCRAAGVPVFVKALELGGKIVHDTGHPDWPAWAVRELPSMIGAKS